MAELVQERYAQALFDVALQNNIHDEVLTELNALSDILTQNSDYYKLLYSPVISKSEKHKLISNVFDGKILTITKNFLFILCDNNRVKYLKNITSEYKTLLDQHNNIMEITATMAVMPSDAILNKLKAKLETDTQKKVRLNIKIDESIMGGIILNAENTMIDNSVKSKLNAIKNLIKNTTI